ncbi:MAG: hypothetical protein GY861_16015, partial [bacterium]|nr:hypothetical protein [bacterium]
NIGLNQEDISRKLNRDCDTLFINSKEKHPEIVSGYLDGKRAHKEKLLKDIEDIGDDATDNKRLQYDIKKYQLNVLHKTRETNKQEVEAKVSGDISVNIITGGK